jgi:hypothetical protein
MKKVYISGPISGKPRREYLAEFAAAEKVLKNEGYKVINPTKFLMCRCLWLYKLLGYRLTIIYDLYKLSGCDMIYKIPGWKDSRGANIESCFAYHMKIWTLGVQERGGVDAAVAKALHQIRQKG